VREAAFSLSHKAPESRNYQERKREGERSSAYLLDLLYVGSEAGGTEQDRERERERERAREERRIY
jgi:hypothetical protein